MAVPLFHRIMHSIGGHDDALIDLLPRAQRIVLSDFAAHCVARLDAQITEDLDTYVKAIRATFMPFDLFWLEGKSMSPAGDDGTDLQIGCIVSCDQDGRQTRGRIGLVLGMPSTWRAVPAAYWFDFKEETRPGFMGVGHSSGSDETDFQAAHFLRFLVSAVSLIASKGVCHTVEPDLSKMNKMRRRVGRAPIMAYTEIKLNIDVERELRASVGTATGSMPMHPVRAHLRLLPTGRITMVRAHWRGNPDNGIRHHHYIVETADDTAGSPKPAPGASQPSPQLRRKPPSG
jgi:hypothetical protein